MIITYPSLKEESIQRIRHPDRMRLQFHGSHNEVEFNETVIFLCDDGRVLDEHQKPFEAHVEQAINDLLEDEFSDAEWEGA